LARHAAPCVATLRPDIDWNHWSSSIGQVWPALLAAVTSLDGKVTGALRTFLDPSGRKAGIASPRRALGKLARHGVRFGTAHDVMAVGEGLETILSVHTAVPMPVAAALSAGNLTFFEPPVTLRRFRSHRTTTRPVSRPRGISACGCSASGSKRSC
jgi:hypothetical protein